MVLIHTACSCVIGAGFIVCFFNGIAIFSFDVVSSLLVRF